VATVVEAIEEFAATSGWDLAGAIEVPAREQQVVPTAGLGLNRLALRYLGTRFQQGLYAHQYDALRLLLDGKNICMLTGTASGKSLVFYVAGLEAIAQTEQDRILALYPLRALGREQESRWAEAFQLAGLPPGLVRRIDGSVPVATRSQILRDSRVVTATPDVIHAWLLSSLSDTAVLSFLRRLKYLIVDEIHNYAGVFGSNSAYLFRRIRHCLACLGVSPRIITASATVASPDVHLRNLFGLEFSLIPQDRDTSPRQQLSVRMTTPPRASDLLTEVARLLEFLARSTAASFIAFVDSRKMSEQLAAIVSRTEAPEADEEQEEEVHKFDHLARFSVLPYRSGYEEEDRDKIQQRLVGGSLRGVVSTSALELGIDIPHLDCGVLVGVPRSATSLMQRIGRVGRRVPGCAVIVNTGSLHDESVFRQPERLLNRPLTESALYLENRRIQYIHALCLARIGGEHDQLAEAMGLRTEQEISSGVEWPAGFQELVRMERLGELGAGLQGIKAEAGDNPNHAFPLRDVESQFSVELRAGPESRHLGSLSYSQVLREAYPGAIYYYTALPHRVSKIDTIGRAVTVRSTRRYFTTPLTLPTLVFPNLSFDSVHDARMYGDHLIVIECDVQVRESVSGFVERRGPTKTTYNYPISPIDTARAGISFRQSRLARNYFTTGLVVTHPLLATDASLSARAAELIYETFLSQIPFERQDINHATDRHRADRPPYANQGERFIALYDQTYGSLRLTSRLAEPDVLRKVLRGAVEVALIPDIQADPRLIELLNTLAEAATSSPQPLAATGPTVAPDTRYAKVILPGSRGVVITRANEEAKIVRVFVHPASGLCYRVEYEGMLPNQEIEIVVPVQHIADIPGESQVGWYDYHTGDVLDRLP
jgi:DEAD/DEAH box helicase domain-containing protein